MIGKKKIALIHVAKNKLSLSDDEYRDILLRVAGVNSSLDLDFEVFEAVMDYFNRMGFESISKKESNNKRRKQSAKNLEGDTITPAQQEYIKDLYNKLGWHKSKRRTGFNRRQIGKPWAQTKKEATQVIEGLKNMLQRQGQKE